MDILCNFCMLFRQFSFRFWQVLFFSICFVFQLGTSMAFWGTSNNHFFSHECLKSTFFWFLYFLKKNYFLADSSLSSFRLWSKPFVFFYVCPLEFHATVFIMFLWNFLSRISSICDVPLSDFSPPTSVVWSLLLLHHSVSLSSCFFYAFLWIRWNADFEKLFFLSCNLPTKIFKIDHLWVICEHKFETKTYFTSLPAEIRLEKHHSLLLVFLE